MGRLQEFREGGGFSVGKMIAGEYGSLGKDWTLRTWWAGAFLWLEVWGLTCVTSWELNSFQPVIPHQCVWGCTSFISFILTVTSAYSLFHDTWTLGARILLEMYPYVYMGLSSTCLNFELLWFSSMFSVAKRYFLDEEWVLQLPLGIRTYLECSLAVCLLVKGQL